MTITQSLVVGFRAAKEARKTAKPAGQGVVAAAFGRLARSLMVIAGLGLISAAGLLFNIEAGLVVAGLSCFVLDYELSLHV